MAKSNPTHVVLRPFDGPEGRYKIGERVSARDWRTMPSLERQRFIRPLGVADIEATKVGAQKEA